MLIKILNVDVEQQTAKNGRAYEIAEVLYSADGKAGNKKIMSFSNPGVFKTLKEAKKGDTFDVALQKDDKGYWQWSGISAGGSSEKATASASVSQNTNRSFETKEERDARQRLIVRQSSLAQAITFALGGHAKDDVSEEQVIALADRFTDWVFEKVDLFDQPDDLPD